jgi:hypothetical protein
MYAKDYAGTDVYMEMDAANNAHGLPSRVHSELATADSVITMDNVFAGKWLDESQLNDLGLTVVVPSLNGSTYRVWRKTAILSDHPKPVAMPGQ